MRVERMGLALVLPAALATPAAAQIIRVAPATVVAREAEPRRFAEPHLAIHPSNPAHLLGGAWSALTTADPNQARRCAAFASVDRGVSWSRHDFPYENCYDEQVAILPDGQAVFVALATLPNLAPLRNDWLVVFHSSDGGLTWDPAPTTLGWRFDHPSVAVDAGSGTRAGWVYITSHLEWGDGTPQRKSAVFVARSRDGGKTWDVPALAAPNTLHNYAETPVVLSDGTLVASLWTTRGRRRSRRAGMPGLCGRPTAVSRSGLLGSSTRHAVGHRTSSCPRSPSIVRPGRFAIASISRAARPPAARSW